MKIKKSISLWLIGTGSLAALVALFRLYLLRTLPIGPSTREVSLIQQATEPLLRDMFHSGSSPVYLFILRLTSNLAERSRDLSTLGFLYHLRLSSVALSLLAWIFTYLAIRKLFSERVALLSGLFFAIQFPLILFGRSVGPEALAVLLLSIGLFCIAHFKHIAAKIGFYITTLFLVLSIPEGAVWVTLILVAVGVYIYSKRLSIIDKIVHASASAVSLGLFYLAHKLNYLHYKPANLKVFFIELRGLVLSPGSTNATFNTPGIPIFDILVSVLLLLSILYLYSSYSKKVRLYFVTATVFALIAALFALPITPASFNLLYYVVIILVAVLFDVGLSNWLRLFPLNKLAKSFGVVFAVIFLFVSMLYSYNRFFIAFEGSPEVSAAYHDGATESADLAKTANKPVLVLGSDDTVMMFKVLLRGKAGVEKLNTLPDNYRDYLLIVDPTEKLSAEVATKLQTDQSTQKKSITNRLMQTVYIIYSF